MAKLSDEPRIALEAQQGRIHLRMTALLMGRDLSVTLSGGDRPHIGAVALAAPRAPASVLSRPNHREDTLAQQIAITLATELNATVCVTCGIHLENILENEINVILKMADALTRQLSRHLEGISR